MLGLKKPGILFFCKATTPPQIGRNLFYDMNNIPIIYVPQESVDAYKTAEGWSVWADMITGYNF